MPFDTVAGIGICGWPGRNFWWEDQHGDLASTEIVARSAEARSPDSTDFTVLATDGIQDHVVGPKVHGANHSFMTLPVLSCYPSMFYKESKILLPLPPIESKHREQGLAIF